MKLIKELVEEVQFIAEANEGHKNYFIEGVFLQSEIKNRNGRKYPRDVMRREVNRYVKEYVEPKERSVNSDILMAQLSILTAFRI